MVYIPSDMVQTMFVGVVMFIVAAGLLSTEQFKLISSVSKKTSDGTIYTARRSTTAELLILVWTK